MTRKVRWQLRSIRLRTHGGSATLVFSEQQAEGQAEALAAAMTDSLATKQDLTELDARIDARFALTRQGLRELEARIGARFAQIDVRFAQVDARFAQIDGRFLQVDARLDHLERHFDARLVELERRIDREMASKVDLADLERRMTIRLGGITVAGIGVVSALVKML